MSETRARRRIRNAVESRGYAVESLEWEPWYDGGEMNGLGGGWTLILDRNYVPNTTPGNDLYGYSVEEVLAYIDYWLRPIESCACNLQHDPMTACRLIEDPEKPTHDTECRWHIRYRLPWWTAEVPL